MDENKPIDNEENLENITRHECGCRLCKCGDGQCEYGADFFDEDGHPTTEFGNDDDLIQKQQLEAAYDFTEYAERVGLGDDDIMLRNGESLYRNTADYRMIDPSCESADSGKS